MGLPAAFALENGKFQMLGGEQKVRDNLLFTLSFIGWHRIYLTDFVPDILFLLQKPVSFIQSLKVIILGRFQKSLSKYLPYIQVNGINVIYDYKNRKEYGIGITYTYNLEPEEQFTIIRFIQIT